ncbi:hypothetical protein SADO_12228 [Salinisphaera dokdonensis CL-ES53]|uniref:Uncharacterized protein n=2 Tax=Salinisphaera TaxID=180541 RepID=A0ABV2B2B3_9GAMM
MLSGNGMGTDLFKNRHLFLTADDRSMLSDMYAYADSQGADLNYVDSVAYDLADYRRKDNGRIVANANNGNRFDSEGHQKTFSFIEADAATAERIKNSDALNSTRFDLGFLEFHLDPGYDFNHTTDFDFLEAMVTKFSDSDQAQTTGLPSKFQTHTSNGANAYEVHYSEEVVLEPYTVDHASGDAAQQGLDKTQSIVDEIRAGMQDGRLLKAQFWLGLLR